jgi:tetratricopeptide (TPR) repeat protein
MKALPAAVLDLPRARFLYAVVLARSGRTQDAIFELERILTRQSDHEAANRLYAALRPRSPATISAAAVSRAPISKAPSSAAPRTAAPRTAAPRAPRTVAAATVPKRAPRTAAPKPAPKKTVKSTPKKRTPRGFDGLMSAARKAQEHGRTTQARRLLLQALTAKPNHPEALSSLGWCDVDEGKHQRAINYFRRALSRSDGYADARYGLGVALERSGQKSAAKKVYQDYLQKHPRGRRKRIVERKVSIL